MKWKRFTPEETVLLRNNPYTLKVTERTKYVAFITKEHCLYNGIYDKEQKLFTTYDGLVFRQNEIISWCNDRYLDYMIKYVEYPTDKLYERNG